MVAVAGFVVALAVVLIGGYGFGWRWTGLDGKKLWDWLELLLLPGSLAVFALWFSLRGAAPTPWRIALATIFVSVGVIAVGSYGLGWTWTGFQGNELWDWLHLWVLPLTLMLLPAWLASRGTHRRQWLAVEVTVVAFLAVTVIGGYGFGWKWTGFAGNRVWDWMNLLIVPFVLPALAAWVGIRSDTDASAPELVDVRDVVSLQNGTVTVTPGSVGVVVDVDDGAGARSRQVLSPQDARRLAAALLSAASD
jgi:hypothetical protein